MKKYLLDTNVFIEAYRRYYAEKIVPSFWKFLEKDKDIFTLKAVKIEINKGNDTLRDLIKNIKISDTILDSSNKISDYIHKNYKESVASKFLDRGADFSLLSTVLSTDYANTEE